MEEKARIDFYRNQIELEKQIIEAAEKSRDIKNVMIRELILGIANDSHKHISLLRTLIAINEQFALLDEKITEHLKKNLEDHISLEQRAIDTYQELFKQLMDDKEKTIIKAILNDEIRHHGLLKQLHKKIVKKITFTDDDYWEWAWKDTDWQIGT